MKIKICGLFREPDIDYVNEAGPDYAGFVFAESRRRISPETALAMRRNLSPRIVPVGVFADQELAFVNGVVEMGAIDIVQLHGGEPPSYISAVKAPVIKAVRLGGGGGWPACPFLLIDGVSPGSGRVFDWGLIPEEIETPYFLAGGISAGNVGEAMSLRPAPYGIDVSSGVETDGVKDREKIIEIVRRVRNG